MKILVTGCDGMLGRDIVNEFSDCDVHAFGRNRLDITDKLNVDKHLKKIKPNILVNCAAYTDVDGSELNRKEAMKINALAVKNLAGACKKNNTILVHFSTDYVFDGSNKNGYKEDSIKKSVNFYGHTKSMGEDYIIDSLKAHYIIRTSWLFGKNGRNFVQVILSKSGEKEIKVVNDQKGCPTYTKDLAKSTRILIENYPYGIYHVTNSGSCTWFEFAREILKNAKSRAKLLPMKSRQLHRPAERPKYSMLISTKFKNKLPFWKDALKNYMGEIHERGNPGRRERKQAASMH